jgi:hypothetical protein
VVTKIALAGYIGAGKTSFMLGLYHFLKCGRFRFSEDNFQDPVWDSDYQDFKNKRTPPPSTGAPKHVAWSTRYCDAITIELVFRDYKGGDLEESLTAESNATTMQATLKREIVDNLNAPLFNSRRTVDVPLFKVEGSVEYGATGEYLADADFLFLFYDASRNEQAKKGWNILNQLIEKILPNDNMLRMRKKMAPKMAIIFSKADLIFDAHRPPMDDGPFRLRRKNCSGSISWLLDRNNSLYHNAGMNILNKYDLSPDNRRIREGIPVFPVSAMGDEEMHPNSIEPFGYEQLFDWIASNLPQSKLPQ